MDIHMKTAVDIFNKPTKDITPQMRKQAMAVNFGIIYGGNSFTISDIKDRFNNNCGE